jgi:hypothetical protein
MLLLFVAIILTFLIWIFAQLPFWVGIFFLVLAFLLASASSEY